MDDLLGRIKGSGDISSSDLQGLAKRASDMFLRDGMSLNQAVVKLASEQCGLTIEHVKRMVSMANNTTFQALFEKKAEDKNIDFDVADPREVLRSLDNAGRPAQTIVTPDYGTDATKLGASVKNVEADTLLATEFGLVDGDAKMAELKQLKIGGVAGEKIAASLQNSLTVEEARKTAAARMDYPQVNPFGELYRTKQMLEKLADDSRAARFKNVQLHEEAFGKLAHEVKQYLLNDGNFGELVHLMHTTGGDEWTKTAMEKLAGELAGNVFKPIQARAEMIEYEMVKGANARLPNIDHPIVQAFGAFVRTKLAQAKIDEAHSQMESLLGKTNDMIAKVARDPHAA